MKIILLGMLTAQVLGCSLATVSRMSSGSRGMVRTSDSRPSEYECTTSTVAPGFDVVLAELAAIGFIASAAQTDKNNASAPNAPLMGVAAIAAVLSVGSAGYGFDHTKECRQAIRESRGLNTEVDEDMGANDWEYPVVIANIVPIAVVVAMAIAGSNSHAGSNQDACTLISTVTAICNDGAPSCSLHRSGTCSWHNGVRYFTNESYMND